MYRWNGIIHVFIFGVMFKFNPKFVLDGWNKYHFGLFLLASYFSLLLGWKILTDLGIFVIVWETVDGVKPLWNEYTPIYYDWRDKFRELFLFSDGFSWSDAFFGLTAILIGNGLFKLTQLIFL